MNDEQLAMMVKDPFLPFEEDYAKKYIEEGLYDGQLKGRERAYDEGFSLGLDEGTKLGYWLGNIVGNLFCLLELCQKGRVERTDQLGYKISRLMERIRSVSLKNEENPEKDQLLLKIHGFYAELNRMHPQLLPPVNFPFDKANSQLDF